MRRLALFCVVICLAGCSTTTPYGTHTDVRSHTAQEALVQDAVSQLRQHYPPAITQFDLSHAVAAQDRFGMQLISELQQSGYAVALAQKGKAQTTASRFGVGFSYLLDSPKETDFYRLYLKVGDSALSRAYQEQGGQLVPTTVWMHFRGYA
jgi:hypothetical protein